MPKNKISRISRIETLRNWVAEKYKQGIFRGYDTKIFITHGKK